VDDGGGDDPATGLRWSWTSWRLAKREWCSARDGARPTADVQRLRAMSRKDGQCVGNGVDVCRREGAMSGSYAADSTEVDSEANGVGGGQTGRRRLASIEMVLGVVMALCDDAPLSQSRVERGAGGGRVGAAMRGADHRRCGSLGVAVIAAEPTVG
jgi:hypothetical protein